jgi:hypothetical protein
MRSVYAFDRVSLLDDAEPDPEPDPGGPADAERTGGDDPPDALIAD